MEKVPPIHLPDADVIGRLERTQFWKRIHHKANEVLKAIIPGTHIVAHPEDAKEVEKLAENPRQGVLSKIRYDGENVVLTKLQQNRCHLNSMALLIAGKAEKMYTGYGLTADDGLWRHHSWCIDKDGRVIETTVVRAYYVAVTEVHLSDIKRLLLNATD